MQDRYEVGVVSRLRDDWQVLKNARFMRDDPLAKEWRDSRTGVYTTNGVALAAIKKSDPNRRLPDLFAFALTKHAADLGDVRHDLQHHENWSGIIRELKPDGASVELEWNISPTFTSVAVAQSFLWICR